MERKLKVYFMFTHVYRAATYKDYRTKLFLLF